MNLGAFRTAVAGVLDPLDPDWTVLASPVDALDPPAFLLAWSGTPDWIVRDAGCFVRAQLDVIVVADRLEIEGTYPILEQMVDAALPALLNHRPAFALVGTVAPAPLEIGQITYLAARIVVAQPMAY